MSFEQVAESMEQVATNLQKFRDDQHEMADRLLALEQKGTISAGATVAEGAGASAVRIALDKSDALRTLQAGQTRSATIPLGATIKSLVGDATGGYAAPAQLQPGIFGVGKRPLTLLDLLPSLPVSASSFQFNQVAGYSNTAGVQVAQGDTKATQAFTLALETANIATIAAVTGVSEQVLADAPVLQGQIANLLRYGVMAKLESEVVAGAGGTGKISGLTMLGTAFTPTGTPSNIDAVSECIAHLASIGWNPSAVALNPADWHTIRTSKASTSGVYLSGTYDQAAQATAWGVPVVQSAALTAGTALVLDTSQCLLLDRQNAVVDIGRENADFSQNIIKIRCELRAGLAVFAPTAVQVITLA